MDEAGAKRRSLDNDRLSNLPDPLLCKILLNLRTKDVVKTSVLSTRWRNLWTWVPGLVLDSNGFKESYEFVRFVDRFLGFNSELHINTFKLGYHGNGNGKRETNLLRRWFNIVFMLKVKNLEFADYLRGSVAFRIPYTIYTCESLVCLNLSMVTMSSLKFVSLPLLRIIKLCLVKFTNSLDLETLISGCPALETLVLGTSICDLRQVLRVCSHSLLSFTYVAHMRFDEDDPEVVIDAPKLAYLRLSDYRTASFIIKYPGSLVTVDINIMFKMFLNETFDLPKINMIRNFLVGISCVKNMTISSDTLEVIYGYARCEPLPLFRNLSFLRVMFSDYRWEMLPTFLESCPNLKSCVLGSTEKLKKKRFNNFSEPRGFLPSLEYVEIKRPLKGEVMEMKLVGYFLEKSTILKKLTLCLDDSRKNEESVILKELHTIPRLSTSCQVVIL